jgi:DNA repair exonuclease SbcCD ATPase subunit
VSMSRARQDALVHVVADDVNQAKGDLAQDWSNDRRQRWAIDTGTPTTAVADIENEPEAPTRLQAVIREARLRSERDAVASAIPAEVGGELRDASRQLAALEARRHDLETGGAPYWQTPGGRAGATVHRLTDRLEAERRRADDRELSRSQRRSARYELRDLTPQLDDALEHWKAVCGAEHARLTAQIDRLAETIETLQEWHDHRHDWLDRHPEAVRRLERLDRELDAYRLEPVQRIVGRAIAYDAPSRPAARELDGPDLGL